MKRTKSESGQRSTFLSRFPKIEVSGAGVLLRWVFLQTKEAKSTLILGTCNINSFCNFPLRKEIKRKESSSGKRELFSFKLPKSESLVRVSL